jgi:hypothetical protein
MLKGIFFASLFASGITRVVAPPAPVQLVAGPDWFELVYQNPRGSVYYVPGT